MWAATFDLRRAHSSFRQKFANTLYLADYCELPAACNLSSRQQQRNEAERHHVPNHASTIFCLALISSRQAGGWSDFIARRVREQLLKLA